MPLRSDLLTKRWPTIELPILPFLAPRVFSPWPSFGRRAYSGAQPAPNHDTQEETRGIGLAEAAEEERLRREKQDFTLLRLAGKEPGTSKRRTVRELEADWKTWGKVSKLVGENVEAAGDAKEPSSGFGPHGTQEEKLDIELPKSAEGERLRRQERVLALPKLAGKVPGRRQRRAVRQSASGSSCDDSFRRKYEEIWGGGKTDPSQWVDLEADISRSRRTAPASEVAQSARGILQEVEAIVGQREEAKLREDQHAIVSRKKAEQNPEAEASGPVVFERRQRRKRSKAVRHWRAIEGLDQRSLARDLHFGSLKDLSWRSIKGLDRRSFAKNLHFGFVKDSSGSIEDVSWRSIMDLDRRSVARALYWNKVKDSHRRSVKDLYLRPAKALHWRSVKDLRWRSIKGLRWRSFKDVRWRSFKDVRWRSVTDVRWRSVTDLYWKSIKDTYLKTILKGSRSYARPIWASRRLLLTPKLPVKIARWSPSQAPDSLFFWQKRFTRLRLRLEGTPKMIDHEACLADPSFYEGLLRTDCSTSLRKSWEALPAEKRGDLWPDLMLTALNERPTEVLKLLVATYVEPYPPGYAVSDSLDHVVSYYLGNRTNRNPKNALEILRVFQHMLRLTPRGHIHLSQKSVHLLLKNLDDVFVRVLYEVLTETGHPMTRHTLMHFAPKVRLSSGPDERIEILQKMWEKGSDFNSPQVLSVCASLLQRKGRSSELRYSDSEIFEFMLQCGVKPNIIIYNVLLQNSLESHDPETAWQIHDMMVENGVETDAYTYSLLFTDAKLRNDRNTIKRILSIIGAKHMRNAHVATDILHMIDLFRQESEMFVQWGESGRPPKLSERMLKVYRQYFRLEPLAHIVPWLGSLYPNSTSSARSNMPESTTLSKNSLMDPEIPTLVVMLTILLRERTEPAPVVQFYNRFSDLLKAGDPIATALAQSTHVYNIVLMALGRFSETLALCPRIIGDMLSANTTAIFSNVDAPSASSEAQTLAQFHPKPDIYTWSILLKVFMDHGQPRAAEKVLSMMEERKVYPNQVTWNSLIVGYARMQDMSMTVNAIDRLKRSGYDLDEVTMKGLSFFQNRRALIEAMKASDAKNAGKSIRKRPRAMGLALGALNKTLRMVQDGVEGDGLQPEADVMDDEDEVSSSTVYEEEGEFVVRDIPREDDKVASVDDL
jgi:pentatricopeptide repeat protein